MNVQKAKDKYLKAAILHSTTDAEDWASIRKVNKTVATILKALKTLRLTPDRGEAFLKEVLTNENPGVRCWAAADLLPLSDLLAAVSGQAIETGLAAQPFLGQAFPRDESPGDQKSQRRIP